MDNETLQQESGRNTAEDKGSVLLGIAGALLGALVGAIPWFLASTFTSFFIGWLGFLIGWAAAFGYRTLHGRRSYGLAMTVVVLSSIAALVLADFASNMYLLCTDVSWQRAAERYGVSVAELAAVSIIDRENLGVILPGLGMGLFIGLLGVLSASSHVRQYTDPDFAARVQAQAQPNLGALSAMNRGWAAPASTGLQLPPQFTVRVPRRNLILGVVLLVVFGVLFLASLVIGALSDAGAVMLFVAALYACLMALAVLLILQRKNWRLEVDGDWLEGSTTTGKRTRFHASEIAGVSISTLNGCAKLKDRNGQVLFKYTNIMENQPLLTQYLAEHNVPLQG